MTEDELKILTATIHDELIELRNNLKLSCPELQAHYYSLEKQLCGKIEEGYAMYFKTIRDGGYSQGIKQSQVQLNWTAGERVEQAKTQALILDDIAQVMGIPDIEKERKLYIEKGLNYFRKAGINNHFYADSKRFYEKALTHDELDFFVLYNLGLIHLFSNTHKKIEKALHYFQKAAIYALAEINHKKLSYSKHHASFLSGITPASIALNAFTYKARCHYILEQNHAAIEAINQAIEIAPKDSTALFDKLKYYVDFRQTDDIPLLLAKMIENDYFIVLRILKDLSLITVPEIRDFLTKLTPDSIKTAETLINECKAIISPESPLNNKLTAAQEELKKGNYLAVRKALNILTPHL